MDLDINKYITITKQKNGKAKFSFDGNNEANIYNLLYELGFRKSKLQNKRIYFQRTGKDLVPVTINDIRTEFNNMLRGFKFKNVPEYIRYSNIINWFFERQTIKENKLLDQHLKVDLDESETHTLRLKTDTEYKHNYEIENTLLRFKKWGLKETIDSGSGICHVAPLFYKRLSNGEFLIFIYFNSTSKLSNDGFDCYIASYDDENNVGKTIPNRIAEVKLGFDLKEDLKLVKECL